MSRRVEAPITTQFQAIKADLDASQVAAKEQKLKAEAALQKIQKRIEKGESTGDRITDLLIVRYGLSAPEYEERYRNLQEKVKQHKGQLVLLVSRWEDYSGCTGFGGGTNLRDYVLKTTVALGLMEEKGLVIDPKGKSGIPVELMLSGSGFGRGKCGFPTDGYALASVGGIRRIRVEPGCLPADLTQMNENVQLRNRQNALFGLDHPKKLEVFVGNSDVIRWFAQPAGGPWEKVTDPKPTEFLQEMTSAINRPLNRQIRFRI